jgi:hypothetical protein
MWDYSAHSQSISEIQTFISICEKWGEPGRLTLFAGFVFNFSNIFCHCWGAASVESDIFIAIRERAGWIDDRRRRGSTKSLFLSWVARWCEMEFMSRSGPDCDWDSF